MHHPILSLIEKPSRLVIGFMSGTSADGIDAVLTRITGFGLTTKVEQLAFFFLPFSREIRAEILRIAGGGEATAEDICRMNFLIGHLHCQAGLSLCELAGIDREEVDLIGFHGQTFWHIPVETEYLGYSFRSTLQLGEDSLLAETFGCPVVGDFRVRDVAAGGLGAPLVPYTEYLLYRSAEECIALQNIGGIGNITIMPAGCELKDVHAFDTGPGNMIIDAVISHISNGKLQYDHHGEMASKGKVHPELLSHLLDDPYLRTAPPKTTGREKYGPGYVADLLKWCDEHAIPPLDTLATVTRFTAETIARGIHDFAMQKPSRLIVGGGGSLNQTLMNHLRDLLPNCQVLVNEDLGLDSNAKEAIAFAILANECIFASCNNAPRATGAQHPVVMGKISL